MQIRAINHQRGFSIVETMVAALILIISLAGFEALMFVASQQNMMGRMRVEGTQAAKMAVEPVFKAGASQTNVTTELSSFPKQVVSGNRIYTVSLLSLTDYNGNVIAASAVTSSTAPVTVTLSVVSAADPNHPIKPTYTIYF